MANTIAMMISIAMIPRYRNADILEMYTGLLGATIARTRMLVAIYGDSVLQPKSKPSLWL
jgi:hypothetical protein